MTRTTPHHHGSRKWLELVHAQSYGKSIGAMPARFEPPALPGLGNGELPLSWEAAALVDDATSPATVSAAPRGSFWERLQALLYGAFGTLRHEPQGTYNSHRAYPSARCLFPVNVYVLLGRDAYRYEPLRHALRPVGDAPAIQETTAGATIALVGSYASIPAAYGPLRHALTVLEGGHALRAAGTCAAALGLAPAVELAFADEELLARLRLPADGSFGPLALLGLDAAPAASTSRLAEPRPPLDVVSELERACWLRERDVEPYRRRRRLPGTAGPPGARLLPSTPTASPRPLRDVLYARTAGRGSGGLSASAAPIPATLVHAAAADAIHPPPRCGTRLLVVAERVAGLADGIHEVHAEDGTISTLRAGRFLAGVQRAFSYPPETTNICSMNLAWMLVTDTRAVLDRFGPRGLRLAHLEMGAIAQALASSLSAGGMFARPIRSYHEAVLDALLGLSPSESVGYQLLCGVQRFPDVVFDLRPPTRRREAT